MKHHGTILAITFAAFVAAWGCGKSPNTDPVAADGNQLKALDGRVAKLEKELKAAEVARDAARKQANDSENKFKNEQVRALAVEKEREELRDGLKARTAEREALQVQMDGFRKNLKDLLGQVEAASGVLPAPTIPSPAQPAATSTLSLPPPSL
ncbi:hypothetical protein [Fimbriiglobus ruber]|uniref:Uncharacterized protein n=1 Tax=Fimbriiglobus ruber TaxID=1908690 RepID=A0A225DGN9_9BACT|nr:hypothetical protein [Fimbriiglobus ruber]OWK36339.1 hypothetical protein FRUB_08902 [Fimbriiglobus ruber]